MLKKTITYTNPFTNKEVTEDHYFHISKADLAEMEMSHKGGMKQYLERIVAAEDGNAIVTEFKELIRRSYGKKEGDRFIKTAEAWNEFYSSEAYSQLFFELCTDADQAAQFMNSVVPNNLEAELAKLTPNKPAEKDPTGLSNPLTARVLTPGEILEMDADDLKSGLASGRYKLS